MWSSRLFWKLFVVYAGLTIALTVGLLWMVIRWEADYAEQETLARLRQEAQRLREFVTREAEAADLQQRLQTINDDSSIRLTVIAEDGRVIADSQDNPGQMENHLHRPEIREAAVSGMGSSQRYSSTVDERLIYLALPLTIQNERRGFVRVATSLDTVHARMSEILRLALVVAIVFVLLAIAVTYFLVGRMMQPLSELLQCSQAIARGDYSRRVHIASRDELGMLAVAFNHMQQQLAHQMSRLEENSERLETVLGSMREGVLAVDNQQRVLFANAASRTMLDIRTGEIVGRPLIEATRVRPVHDAVEFVLTKNQTLEADFESSTVRRRVVAMRAARLPGEPTPGVVLVLHDITELRRLENLRQEFVANVSHELKTPLTSIKAYAETLRMGAINDSRHNMEFVSRIEEQGDRLHQLIVDLLHIARIESGEESFEIAPTDVAQIIERAQPYLRKAADEKRLDFQVQSPPTPSVVAADDDGLRTIVDNLVMNAIRYTPEGGRVELRWRAEGQWCTIEVEDTGIGIAPPDQARIFERFYRVDKARSRELGGTGLGLAIVKHLTQAFGGTIAVESALNKGSMFRIRLPLVAGGKAEVVGAPPASG